MKAMVLPAVTSLDANPEPLQLVERPCPEPGPGDVLVKVSACGVCHTELDEIEGRTVPPRLPVVPGHEVVGRIASLGPGVRRRRVGERVGVGWIYSSTGGAEENISPEFRATGRDADGGYAEYMVAPENYVYPIPEVFGDAQAAPLLCAGAIGYRALRLTGIRDGDSLGLTGFGGSAHLVLQLVRYLYPRTAVHVFAREARSRAFAESLGAASSGDITTPAPAPLQAIIDTTPAWKPLVAALANLRPGGRLVVNAIRKEDRDREALLGLSYHEHLWMEREIKSVANITHDDIAEFLTVAAAIPLDPTIETYPLEQANRALVDLKSGSVQGAKVLLMDA